MSYIAIQVENLGKLYRIGQRERYGSLRDTLVDSISAPVRALRSAVSNRGRKSTLMGDQVGYFWALKDIDFTVKHGEALGIIGRNGAGKSTLLKVLSHITQPTEGRAIIHGRIASLLEVGTGFHPELTGRENIYLNGSILGMKRAEIERKFDEIVAFAEVEKFLDTPVKHYSSGMYVRLAFAVAAHLEPEILVVDEVLAVGDAAFQKKCLGKMGDVAKQGRTVLFVSHNMPAVKSLCHRAILLEKGEDIMSGPVPQVVDKYLTGSTLALSAWTRDTGDSGQERGKATIDAVRVVNSEGQPLSQCSLGTPMIVQVDYSVRAAGTVLNVSLSVFSQDEVHVFASASNTDPDWYLQPHPPGSYRSSCIIPGHFFNEGRYTITALLVENGGSIIDDLERIIAVDVIDDGLTRGGYLGYWGGVVRPNLKWHTRRYQVGSDQQ